MIRHYIHIYKKMFKRSMRSNAAVILKITSIHTRLLSQLISALSMRALFDLV